MSNLKSTLENLANDFARSIISALRTASIDELTGISGQARSSGRPGRPAAVAVVETTGGGRKRGRGGRLGRRSTTEIGRMVDNIVTLLQKSPEGLRAEQIREALGVQAKELPRPLADGLTEGRISKTGQKRATTYFAGGKGGEGGAAKRRGGRRKRA
ncbi:MAG TPA: hypothetical protein VM925_08140 [Labilithrix sp.]|jgi:hypothetical protein|nr:hypothetical protein [Labilithrix sp.]